MPVAVVCAVCGKEEQVIPARAKQYRTCSRECAGRRSSLVTAQRVPMVCEVCGEVIQIKPSHKGRRTTCSMICLGELHRRRYVGSGNPNYRGKDAYPCRRTAGNVRQVHREIVLEMFGWDSVPNGWHIHHRDGDRRNNTVDNLALLRRADHRWLHHQLGLAVLRALASGAVALESACGWSDDPQRCHVLLTTAISNQVGVIKPRELLESPAEGNRQPSLSGTEGRFNDYAMESRTDGKGARARGSHWADEIV